MSQSNRKSLRGLQNHLKTNLTFRSNTKPLPRGFLFNVTVSKISLYILYIYFYLYRFIFS